MLDPLSLLILNKLFSLSINFTWSILEYFVPSRCYGKSFTSKRLIVYPVFFLMLVKTRLGYRKLHQFILSVFSNLINCRCTSLFQGSVLKVLVLKRTKQSPTTSATNKLKEVLMKVISYRPNFLITD